jgi:small conductance mechanosensitive channel
MPPIFPSNEKAGAERRRPAARTARRPPRSRRSARQSRQKRPRGRQSSSARWRRTHGRARTSLQRFRQATILAVALTAIVLLVGTAAEDEAGQPAVDSPQNAAIDGQEPVGEGAPQPGADVDPHQSLEEATATVRELVHGFMAVLPKILVALFLLLMAWILAVVLRWGLHKMLSGWERSEAVAALMRIGLFLLAIAAGLSVIAGDATALLGSVGLIGLALSWALQTPIESFTGWVLNAFRGYYRPGDRIEVGDVFGDVYRIDVLTTTVWEAGGPGKTVAGWQPTGALITFPNWEILRSNIINYSRDFPYIWDEVTFAVANESDLGYTVDVARAIADKTVGHMMREPIANYRDLLERQRLAYDVDDQPQVYLALTDAFTNCTVRYLVPVQQRRRWSTELILAISRELERPEHRGRIVPGYPRTLVDLAGELRRLGQGRDTPQ